MERALLRLGVPPTYVTYRVEYVPTVTGQMVLCTVVVLPHSNLPGFKGEVCYSTALTVVTALDVTCHQALGYLLSQYCATFESGMLRLLPRDYWRLALVVNSVPCHEGIQDDIDAAPFRESDETLVETANYLVNLDKYARRLEDESRTLFARSEMPPLTLASTSRIVFSWRERTKRYASVFASSSRASTARPPSYCSLRGSMWTPVRSCFTSGRISA
jgi:hypothetical protein